MVQTHSYSHSVVTPEVITYNIICSLPFDDHLTAGNSIVSLHHHYHARPFVEFLYLPGTHDTESHAYTLHLSLPYNNIYYNM